MPGNTIFLQKDTVIRAIGNRRGMRFTLDEIKYDVDPPFVARSDGYYVIGYNEDSRMATITPLDESEVIPE